jgi:hypothetical protein
MNQQKVSQQTPENPMDMLKIMEQLGIAHPQLKLYLQLLNSGEDSQITPVGQTEAQLSKNAEQFRALMEEVELLRHNYTLLLERNDMLAAALGACPDCWGEEPNCSACKGQGVPGSMLPLHQEFSRYVMPAIRVVREAAKRRRSKNAVQ